MKKIQYPKVNYSGMTLIEITLYTMLLSLLMVTTIDFLYATHLRNIELSHDIQEAQNQ